MKMIDKIRNYVEKEQKREIEQKIVAMNYPMNSARGCLISIVAYIIVIIVSAWCQAIIISLAFSAFIISIVYIQYYIPIRAYQKQYGSSRMGDEWAEKQKGKQ